MLLYLGDLQNWLDYGHGLVIFLILALFWLSEMGQIWGFQAISRRRHEGNGLKNLHADLSWPPTEMIALTSWFVDLSNFGAILT